MEGTPAGSHTVPTLTTRRGDSSCRGGGGGWGSAASAGCSPSVDEL